MCTPLIGGFELPEGLQLPVKAVKSCNLVNISVWEPDLFL
jgi:hypothetical protein